MPMGRVMSGRHLLGLPLLLACYVPATVASEASPASAWTAQCQQWDDWDKSGPPFRIHGDSYYFGTCGIGAIHLADDSGHVLIDSGTEADAAVVLRNIRFASATGDHCDILLTPHPSASGMHDKLLADDLTSGMNCRQYAASITERLNERLAQEAAPQ